MRFKYLNMVMTAVLACALVIGSTASHACTGIVLKAQDGSPVYARTLEFGAEVVSFGLITVPRGLAYHGQTPDGQPGLAWTVKYGHAGFNPFGMPLLGEGVNEKGLACGSFFLPGFAQYQTYDQADRGRTISNLDFVSWVLGSFASVAEVRRALPQVTVTEVVLKNVSKNFPVFPLPMHFLVVDADGAALVVEYVGGKLHLYDCPLGIITNSPEYPWHMANQRNYIGLSPYNRAPQKVDGLVLKQFGEGSGSIGLPGDFTPPSRFVRANYLAHAAYPGQGPWETVQLALRILNQFDIPLGALRNKQGDKTISDTTQWTSATDLKNRRIYFHTYQNRRVRLVDLNKLDLSGKKILSQPLDQPEKVEDVSARFK